MMLPPPPLGHHRYRTAAHEEGAGDVDGEALLPRLFRYLRERCASGKPGGVVDQHVEAAEIGLHGGDGGTHRFRVRHVALPAHRDAAGRGDHPCRFVRRVGVDVARLDPGSLPGKGERDGPPDAAAGAGDHCTLAGESCRLRHGVLRGFDGTATVSGRTGIPYPKARISDRSLRQATA